MQWCHHSCQTHAGNPLGISGNTPPDLQAVECGRRHFGARCRVLQDGSGPYGRSGQAVGGGPPGARPAALQGQIQSPHRWHGQAQARPFAAVGGAWDRRARHGTQRGGRSADGQASTGTRRQGACGEGSEAHETVRQLRKAGAHPRNLTLTGSNTGVLWGSEILGFTPTQLQGIRVDAAKATYRLSRGHSAATTMMAHAQAAGAKNVDRAFRHQVILAWATGVCEGTRAARLRGRSQPPQAAVVWRNGRSGHLRAHSSAAGLECAVGQAPHHPHWHDDRPLGSGAQDGGLLGRSGIPSVVRQLCSPEYLKGPLFWEAIRPLLVSSWFREAFGPGAARTLQLPALQRRPGHHVPPLP